MERLPRHIMTHIRIMSNCLICFYSFHKYKGNKCGSVKKNKKRSVLSKKNFFIVMFYLITTVIRYNHAWRTEQTMQKLPFLRIVTVYRYSILQINLVLGEKGRPTNQWLCSRPWKTSQKKKWATPQIPCIFPKLKLTFSQKIELSG